MTKSHEDELAAFKASITQQIEDFLTRMEEMGVLKDRAGWKIHKMTLAPVKHHSPHIVFSSTNTATLEKKLRCLYIKNFPEELSSQEQYELRHYINKCCAAAGVRPYQPRKKHLPPEIIQGVRQKDSSSLEIFAQRHWGKIQSYATKYSNRKTTYLDGDDLANETFVAFLRRNKNGAGNSTHPVNTLHQCALRTMGDLTQHSKKYLPEAGGEPENFAALTAPEYDGISEALAEELPLLLEAAKERMNPEDQKLLNIIQIHQPNRESTLTLRDIGRQVGISAENVRLRLQRITKKIAETAAESKDEFPHAASKIRNILHSIELHGKNRWSAR